MIHVFIQGISDGILEIDLESKVEDVPELSEEFFGLISIKGKLRKIGKRYTLDCKIACNANLICDISLKEFVEMIHAELQLSYIADNERYFSQKKSSIENDNIKEIIIPEDLKNIDITEEVREELDISIPMKRIAPEFSDKDFKDIYPELSYDTAKSIDDRWEVLKKLINN